MRNGSRLETVVELTGPGEEVRSLLASHGFPPPPWSLLRELNGGGRHRAAFSASGTPGEIENGLKALSKALESLEWRPSWEVMTREAFDERRKEFKRIGPWVIQECRGSRLPQPPGGRRLILRSGRAFGDGSHYSTRGCIEALEWLHGQGAALHRTLDVGTGTGILALVAARLGATKVLAVDIDPVSKRNALFNAEINGLKGVVEVSNIKVDALPGGWSTVIGNLVPSVLIPLLPVLCGLCDREKGRLIVSGFTTGPFPEVRKGLERHGLIPERVIQCHGWVTIVAS